MEVQKRQIAVKLWINELLSGTYIKEEGFRPNYVLLPDGKKVSRVNLIAVVVSVSDGTNYNNVYVDDGSAKISIRSFEENNALSKLCLGDSVLIIGRPRAFNKEIYLLPEIIKPITDKNWLEIRRFELGKQLAASAPAVSAEEGVVVEDFVNSNKIDIISIIRKLDTGAGADYDAIILQAGEQGEARLKRLLETGELFQPSPGKVKILE